MRSGMMKRGLGILTSLLPGAEAPGGSRGT